MQTFLPYASPVRVARCLDYKRLGKQRVEVLQILRTLHGESKGWRNHPAVRMWRDHVGFLCWYGQCMCEEWIAHGFKDTCAPKIRSYKTGHRIKKPKWLTVEFCLSHRSLLLRKKFGHYRSYFGHNFPQDIPLVWPVPRIPKRRKR